ncbi:TolC family protein [Pseudomonas sp. Z5-35]|uniref:TolC family protein n=1 Tax=unclassified Pseudomonas TaxID=196821 RepID=UPI003DA8891B
MNKKISPRHIFPIFFFISFSANGTERNFIDTLTEAHPNSDIDAHLSPCVFGNLPRGVSLQQTIERILCHDPRTRSTWTQVKIQAALVDVARAAYYPTIKGTARLVNGRNTTNYDERNELSSDGRLRKLSNQLNLSWTLFDFGQREAALRENLQLLAAANANQDALLQMYFFSAAQLYYSALAAQHDLKISKKITALTANNLEAAAARYKSGAAALSDWLQAQTAYSQANVNQIYDAGKFREAVGVIALRMGFPPDIPLNLEDDRAPLPSAELVNDFAALLRQAQQDHPALAAIRAEIRAKEAKLDGNRALGKPILSLTADFSYAQFNQSQMGNQDRSERDRAIGLQLSVPLFDGFRQRSLVSHDLARLEESKDKLFKEEQRLSLELWEGYRTLDTETQRLIQINKLVTQSHQALKVVQGRYNSGIGDMTELLSALSIYANAERQKAATMNVWQITRLKVCQHLGTLGYWNLN